MLRLAELGSMPLDHRLGPVVNSVARDLDGRTRPVTKWGNSKTDAENKLRTALKTRQRTGATSGLRSTDRVSAAVELFVAEVKDFIEQDVLAPNTHQTCRYQYDKNLARRVGELRLHELTTPRVNDVIRAIRDDVGAATAKTGRTVLSKACSLAVTHGALTANPVREITIRATSKKPPRALEEAEREHWFGLLRQDERAVQADLLDITKFMLARPSQ